MPLRDLNWLIDPPSDALRCVVKLRARDEPRDAVVRPAAEGAIVELDEPALPAPGQACVFYRSGIASLAAGIIRRP